MVPLMHRCPPRAPDQDTGETRERDVIPLAYSVGMSSLAITTTSSGSPVVPSSDTEWDDWVAASRTRNHVLGNPLLDWLERHGESKGFARDEMDARTDFLDFIFRKGGQFERSVVDHLRDLGVGEVRTVTRQGEHGAARSLEAAEATWCAMTDGVAIIDQGVLRDPENRFYGIPDLLVRSDVLVELFPDAMPAVWATGTADHLGIGARHYVVVDIKYTTLRANANGLLANSGSILAYKVQLHAYNRALARIQGHFSPRAFLLGRGWQQTVRGKKVRTNDCMTRIAPVEYDEESSGSSLGEMADAAADWIRSVRHEGGAWEVLPEPTVDGLRPDAKADSGEWSGAVKRIVAEGRDLTALYGVSSQMRSKANTAGLTDWHDERVDAKSLGVSRASNALKLDTILSVNRGNGPDVRPEIVKAARPEWIAPAPTEFYIDFETVSDMDDDFSKFPERGGRALIFMVGCGHMEDGEWRFRCFVADDLSEGAQLRMVEEWIAYMEGVAGPDGLGSSRLIHWSAHEVTSLKAHCETYAEHLGVGPTRRGAPEWFDFLTRVVRAEPLVVRGAHGFGIKEVTNALHALGLVETKWGSGPADGLGAMVGAWWCQSELDEGRAERLADVDLMREIRDYNEVDCRAMMEIVAYLRENH